MSQLNRRAGRLCRRCFRSPGRGMCPRQVDDPVVVRLDGDEPHLLAIGRGDREPAQLYVRRPFVSVGRFEAFRIACLDVQAVEPLADGENRN